MPIIKRFFPYVIILVFSLVLFFPNLNNTTLFAIYAIGINISLKSFSPKIDLHLQKDIVDFYKSIQYEDVYCDVVGFKSYAHLFYTFKKNPENKSSLDSEWLLKEEIDKPVYFVSKSQNIEKPLRKTRT